ncbi:copper amine oxidase N-terminal domain-containing protein, partial [Lutibacter sp. B2]|nr:copper amine oxidase N-terminal domain-containing protein [Lutibacter sp. B2]
KFNATVKLKEKDANEFAGGTYNFVLSLENGKFKDTNGDNADPTVTDSVYDAANGSVITINRVSDTEAEVTYKRATTNDTTEAVLDINLPVEVQGEGEVKVIVDADGTPISSGEYVIANAAAGGTVTTIVDTVDFMDDETIETIKIEETSVGAIKNGGKIKVRLQDSDFEWKAGSVTVTYAGGFGSVTQTKTISSNDRDFEFEVDQESSGSRGRIYIEGLVVSSTDEDKYGEVKVKVSGTDISDETMVIGERVDYGVSFKVDQDDDMAELFSGRYEGSGAAAADTAIYQSDEGITEDEHELVTLKIKESVEGAWLASPRKAEIEFPSWVKVIGMDVDSDSKLDFEIEDGKDRNVVTVKRHDNGKIDEDVTFYVSVQADKTGDIEAKISGRAIPTEGKVVLGKAIQTVKVETEPTNLKLGLKNQEIGKITLTETKEEALKEKEVKVVLDEDFTWNETPEVKVVNGDLEIDEDSIETNDNELTFTIKGESTEASKIEITGGTVDLVRYLPEGDYEVEVKGAAIVSNNDENEADGKFDEEKIAKVVIARVITPADDNTTAGQEVNFVIGKTEYKVGEETKTADVAPYIKDGRTMLSLRFAAEAIGVANEDIMWDGVTRTVTIFKGDRIAQVKIGDNKLTVNGTTITMDTVAEIKDGRTMLPVRFVAQALGADVDWDGATRTV